MDYTNDKLKQYDPAVVKGGMLIVGYTTREHLLLDLDETSASRACKLADLIMESWPDVGDCLVVESSTPSQRDYLRYDSQGRPWLRWVYQNFHLVFDAPVGYDRCVAIIDTLVDLDILAPEYKQIRLFRGDMTLRTSAKWLHHRTIPPPKPILSISNNKRHVEYGNIEKYLAFLKITRNLGLT